MDLEQAPPKENKKEEEKRCIYDYKRERSFALQSLNTIFWEKKKASYLFQVWISKEPKGLSS